MYFLTYSSGFWYPRGMYLMKQLVDKENVHMPPPGKDPSGKKGPGRRPGLLGLLVTFSCGCFLKILRHFHAPVKNNAGFVEAG